MIPLMRMSILTADNNPPEQKAANRRMNSTLSLQSTLRFSTFLFLTFFLVSCTSSKRNLPSPLTTYIDPDFSGASYHTVAVWFNHPALDWRKRFEGVMAAYIDSIGGKGLQSGYIASPTRTWDSAALHQAFVDKGVQAILVVEIDQTEVRQRSVPSKTVTTQNTTTSTKETPKEKSTVRAVAGIVKAVAEAVETSTTKEVETETTTETTGGYTYSEDHRRLQVALVDLSSGRKMWVTTIWQSGKIEDDIIDITIRIARQLRVDKMVG
ncbi:MAG: hypothetical protein KDD67_09525 [Ignavibacteriae bacterium]|nr:hypothetical protein [Ignavibacteriota bacterium]MCB9215195.1 hypothetical protein [Ignavibacteria bacterium]